MLFRSNNSSKFDLIEKVCEKQNFDELLLQIVKRNKENRINRILQNIEENKKFDKKLKRQIYEGIFDYVDDVNKYLKNNLKKIFSIAAKETIIQINSELNGGNVDMWRKIKVIIADDNVHFCKFIREYLEKYNDIEILGVANSDEDEIKMIEELKPEIVITDLMRNHRYTGLDIIKKYNDANSKIKFLVISADYKKDVITDELNVAGYIKKPFNDYKVIYDELKRIKKEINESEYKEWLEKYHNLEVRDINNYFTEEDKKIFEKLGIKLKNKIYTEFECESLYMDYLTYYDDPECDLSEEEKEAEFTKALNAALRSDPDVMMVGEIRSLSAAELTFKGALSGHGVWSTLHANSAPAIITRLRDMGIQSYMLGDPELIKGLISQRLFRKLCPYCRKSVKERMNDPSFARLKTALGDFGIENTFIRGDGCKFCGYKGVSGRMSVPEIILPDAMFLQLMINGDTKRAIDYWTSELDGRPLRDAAIERMLKGYIDLDEVERWCGLLDQRPVY